MLKRSNVLADAISDAAAGFKVRLVTLDVPHLGRRLNEHRNNFSVPKGMEWPNLFPGIDVTKLDTESDDSMAYGMMTSGAGSTAYHPFFCSVS